MFGFNDVYPFLKTCHTSEPVNPHLRYNARKNKEQEEIDHILDKIRKSGYDSLSEKEKRKLFENGKK